MSLLTTTPKASGGDTDWAPSLGWHEVRLVAIANVGAEPNKFQDGKLQDKLGLMFAFAETVDVDGTIEPKSKIIKKTASLNEKSWIAATLLEGAEVSLDSISTFQDLIGLTCRMKLAASKTGEYIDIKTIDKADKPLPAVKGLHVPKYWLEGSNPALEIIVEEGVIKALRDGGDAGESTVTADSTDLYN